MKSYVMCTPRHIFFGQPYQRGWNGRSMWQACGRFLFYGVLFRSPEGTRPRGSTGRVDVQRGSENEILSTGLIRSRTRLLWTRQWNSSFIKFREFIENLKRYLFLYEHCSMELVSYFIMQLFAANRAPTFPYIVLAITSIFFIMVLKGKEMVSFKTHIGHFYLCI